MRKLTPQQIESLPKVGFWYSAYEPHFPKPQEAVGEWDPGKLAVVVDHLKNASIGHIQYRGWSNCRICNANLGSRTLSDGVYTWPEKLEHYLVEHSVMLPEDFVQHVMRQTR